MSRIGLIGDNSVEYVRNLLKIWNAGDCAVLIDWRIPDRAAMDMMKEAGVSKCYIDHRLSDRFEGETDIEFICYKTENTLCEFISEDVYELYHDCVSTEEAAILYSSGTTGKAKGIILSYNAIDTNADLISEYMGLMERDCIYIVKTLAHSSTLVGELLVGLKRHVKILISPTINNPRRILMNISRYNVTTLCLNPSLLDLYTKVGKGMTFECLKTIYTSGSVIDVSLIEKAQKTFSNAEILNVYGLSEAGPRVSAQRKGEEYFIGAVGRALRNVEIVIVSEKGVPVSLRSKGIIHIKTPCLFAGYVSGKESRRSLYEDWLNTGDIGYMDETNNLYITGRADNMITVGSHNVYPEEIETLIERFVDVQECIAVSYRNAYENVLICYYVAEKDIATELRAYCMEHLASYEIPAKFRKIDKIPVSNNGKKIRDIRKYPDFSTKV